MQREIIVSATPHESRVAILEDGELVELMFDRPDQGRMVGDVYLGRVEAVLPGIQAAFVDIGSDKAGFLHASDLDDGSDVETDGADENGGNQGGNKGGGRGRKYPPIQDQLQKGQEVLVQVTKEPIGTKGPRLTAQVSLPGRFLVYTPFSNHVGVSRKIEDREERSRLRQMAKQILPDDAGGLIVRTVGEEVTEETIRRELKSLRANWTKIQKRVQSGRAPLLVREEMKLIGGVMRDLFSDKFDSIMVDSREILAGVKSYVSGVAPELMERIHFHSGPVPLFDEHGIEDEIQRAFGPKVDLSSGGHIVIEPTEALVSIDVNTGRDTGRKDPENTILRTNLEAAKEIAKQLRLRDIGGIIVVDFIDMESQQNRDRILHDLRSYLGRDRARTRAFEVSGLGLVEMTRQRVRPSLNQALTEDCDHCGGRGRVYTPSSMVRRLERGLRRAGAVQEERQLVLRVHPEVALHVLENEPDFLDRMSRATRVKLELRDDPLMRPDEFRLLSGRSATDVTHKYTTS